MKNIKDKLLLSNVFILFGISVVTVSFFNIFKIYQFNFDKTLLFLPLTSIFFLFFINFMKYKVIKKNYKIKDKINFLLIFGLIVNIVIMFAPLQELKYFVNLNISLFSINLMIMTVFITLYRDKNEYIESFIFENKNFLRMKDNLIFKSSFRYIEFNLNDLHFKFDKFFGQVSINSEIFDTLEFKSKLNILGIEMSNFKSDNLAVMKILNY